MKKRLFTPGPTPIPETVMLKMAEPIIHHRNPEFNEILTRVNQNLKYLFQTEQPVLTLTCSGTGGVESTFRQSVLSRRYHHRIERRESSVNAG
jgi:aspartate aminotransferase-like enzyme